VVVGTGSRARAAPLPLLDSVMVAWPQIVGLIAASILLFSGGYVAFQRQEAGA